MKGWLPLVLMVVLAGCAQESSPPSLAQVESPEERAAEERTAFDKHFALDPSATACVEPAIRVCARAPPYATGALGYSFVAFNAGENDTWFEVTAWWNATTTATDTLRLRLTDGGASPPWVAEASGGSPLVVRATREQLGESGAYAVWVSSDQEEDVGLARASVAPPQEEIHVVVRVGSLR